MSAITPISILTGLRPEHRVSFAQIGDTVVFTNGHDANYIYSTRSATAYVLGLAAPTLAAPSLAGGALTGTYSYRVRWKDATTATLGPASNVQSVSPAAQTPTIAIPGSIPARATHWVIERTSDGGATYYPLNVDTSNPNGTVIATVTYDDIIPDNTLIGRRIYPNVQNAPSPYRVCFSNIGRVFMLGGRVHQPSCTLANASLAVSSADGGFVPSGFTNLTTPLIGQDLCVPGDADGKSYKIASVTDANNLVLATVYAGVTGTKSVNISGPRDRVIWSEARQVESYGTQEVGVLSNEVRVGDDGAPLIGGTGLGVDGCIYAGESALYVHTYNVNPTYAPRGDGKIIRLQTRRGICGPNAIAYIDGYVYGIDYRGIWRLAPASLPQEIGGPLSSEFVNNAFNFAKADNFHIAYDPYNRWILFFLCENTDTYPKKAYAYDLEAAPGNEWIGTLPFPLGVPCSGQRPDTLGLLRMCYYQEASGAAGSYEYMNGIGTSLGAHPNNVPMSGTVTNGGSGDSTTTITDTAGTFYTTGEKLKGVAVTKTQASDGTSETRIISDNTGTKLTVSSAFTLAPVNGDTYRIGEIQTTYRTGRIYAGIPDRKKTFTTAWVWLRYKPSCVALYLRLYYDGQSSPDSDFAITESEDGVTRTAGSPQITLDSTTFVHRYEIQLNSKPACDLQLEFYSYDAGEPWEIMDVLIDYDFDHSDMPVRR